MKRLTLLSALILCATLSAVAQNYVLVDSEKIFRSLDEYNTALKELDALAEKYQQQVDDRFDQVEESYQTYITRKSSLSQTARQSYEESILKAEEEAIEFQESIFGEQGTLYKRRVEIITPIQERVSAVIESYAKANGFDLVMDSSSNPALLYKSTSIERSDDIINILKR